MAEQTDPIGDAGVTAADAAGSQVATTAAEVPTEGVRDIVSVTLPAASAYLSVLRTATAGLAARMNFTIDEIEDLRIAVDEACAMLLATAEAGAELECEFELTAEVMRVSVTVPTGDGLEPSRDTFAWTVLTALAGRIDSRVDNDKRVTIDLHKRRGNASSTGGG